jgi:hypothetical protein
VRSIALGDTLVFAAAFLAAAAPGFEGVVGLAAGGACAINTTGTTIKIVIENRFI